MTKCSVLMEALMKWEKMLVNMVLQSLKTYEPRDGGHVSVGVVMFGGDGREVDLYEINTGAVFGEED